MLRRTYCSQIFACFIPYLYAVFDIFARSDLRICDGAWMFDWGDGGMEKEKGNSGTCENVGSDNSLFCDGVKFSGSDGGGVADGRYLFYWYDESVKSFVAWDDRGSGDECEV